jgi:hypothetical protein
VTPTRLVLAWLGTAVWFLLASAGTGRLVARLARPGKGPGTGGTPPAVGLAWRLVEAAVLTLFASLWFDSLGRGGWWLLFFLVGVLVAMPQWLRLVAEQALPRRAAVAGACADLARYVVAGGILAWRLR